MNAVRAFVDTNILIYAFTTDEPAKQKVALEFLDDCSPVISTQVVKEFSNILLKKKNLGLQSIEEAINDILDVADIVNEEIALIFAAFDIHKRYHYSFYDSLIIAAGIVSKCKILLSEDMKDGQIIDGKLKIVNPFCNVSKA